MARPGQLTVDYFLERRVCYLPPVRLYLVLSLLFFALGIGFDTRPAVSQLRAGPDTEAAAARAADNAGAQPALEAINAEPGREHGAGEICARIRLSGAPALEHALAEACHRIVADSGQAFLRTLAHNLPRMMFVFLPLVAGFMALLYWRPRRYYVEHLVLLLHNHCATFLYFLVLGLLGWLGKSLHAPSFAITLLETLVWFLMLRYPYAAMRRNYAQGRALTVAKYLAVLLAYALSLLVTLAGTAAISALQS